MSDPKKTDAGGEPLRPHTYDGIQEYDKRLPNWWLLTFYGAIAFSVVYWLYYHHSGVGLSDRQVLAQEMQALEAARLENSLGTLTDEQLWELSQKPELLAAGQATFTTNCVACHLASLRGKDENPGAVGPSLVDNLWIHGGTPLQIRATVAQGVLEKGMPSWGPVLGERRVVEVVAYVLSHHRQGEPVESPAPPASGTVGALLP